MLSKIFFSIYSFTHFFSPKRFIEGLIWAKHVLMEGYKMKVRVYYFQLHKEDRQKRSHYNVS